MKSLVYYSVELMTCPSFTIPCAVVIFCLTILLECLFGSDSRLSLLDAIVAALVHRPGYLLLILLTVTLFTAWKTAEAIAPLLSSHYEHLLLKRHPIRLTRPALEAAKQYKVRLSKIEGTGPGGQITRDDVINFVSAQTFPKGV